MTNPATLRAILNLARWAPSGDNTQPWRFEIAADDHIIVHGFDTRDRCVYDLDGRPSQISIGALLETIALAATRFALRAQIERRLTSPDERPVFDVRLRHEFGIVEDELVGFIETRRVQRRALRLQRLTHAEILSLEHAVAPGICIRWFEGWRDRANATRLNLRTAKLRLTLPEAYRVHRDSIEWNAQESEDRVPAAAIGASTLTLVSMRWAMGSWGRIEFLNRYLAGTLMPRLELDLLPGLACAAHCVLVAQRAPAAIDEYVAAGRALQRFWLTATSLGLQFQPQYLPLVFARYARERTGFSRTEAAMPAAQAIDIALARLLGAEVAGRAMFMGRIGHGRPARARSSRLPLEKLMQH